MGKTTGIMILDGGRRLPRADILVNNKAPGLYSRFSATQRASNSGEVSR